MTLKPVIGMNKSQCCAKVDCLLVSSNKINETTKPLKLYKQQL